MDLDRVIKHPLITEKSLGLEEKDKYVFVVDKKANKHEIERAIRRLFKVEVQSVKTANVRGKRARVPRSRRITKKADWKKAIVTIKEGQKIDLRLKKERK